MPKQAQLPKIKYFHQQIVAEMAVDGGAYDEAEWNRVSETESITDQVNAWVDQTGCVIVSTSAPGYDITWADQEMKVKSIIIGVMVLYKPVENIHERPKRRKSKTTATPKLSNCAASKSKLFS